MCKTWSRVNYNRLLCTILARGHVITWQNSTEHKHSLWTTIASNYCCCVKLCRFSAHIKLGSMHKGEYGKRWWDLTLIILHHRLTPHIHVSVRARRNWSLKFSIIFAVSATIIHPRTQSARLLFVYHCCIVLWRAD